MWYWYVIIIVVILFLLVVWVIGIFNRLVTLRNRVKNAWSQIDVQLQRRYDLIPNLVESVKGYMSHEKGTLEGVTNARNQALSALHQLKQNGGPTESSIKGLLGAESVLKGALGNIFAVAENYPQLRASENMMQLQEELTSTENKIAFSRQAYNDQVLLYNTAQQRIPAVFFAAMFGNHPAELYEVEENEARKAVKVSFDG